MFKKKKDSHRRVKVFELYLSSDLNLVNIKHGSVRHCLEWYDKTGYFSSIFIEGSYIQVHVWVWINLNPGRYSNKEIY